MTAINPATAVMANFGASPDKSGELKKAANAFEAIFLRQMLSSMHQAGLGDEMLSSPQTQQFEAMHFDAIADQMANDQSFGIAEMLQRQFSAGSGGA